MNINRLISYLAACCTLFGAYLRFQQFMQTFNALSLGVTIFYLIMTWLFLFRRPSQNTSTDWKHWIFALSATWLPFFLQIGPKVVSPTLHYVAVMIQYISLVLMIIAIATLGKSFGIIAACREVKTSGMYSWVRHPLYTTEMLFVLALIVQHASPLNIAIFILILGCVVCRMQEEEAILGYDPTYSEYLIKVKYRLLPFVY